MERRNSFQRGTAGALTFRTGRCVLAQWDDLILVYGHLQDPSRHLTTFQDVFRQRSLVHEFRWRMARHPLLSAIQGRLSGSVRRCPKWENMLSDINKALTSAIQAGDMEGDCPPLSDFTFGVPRTAPRFANRAKHFTDHPTGCRRQSLHQKAVSIFERMRHHIERGARVQYSIRNIPNPAKNDLVLDQRLCRDSPRDVSTRSDSQKTNLPLPANHIILA